MEEIFF